MTGTTWPEVPCDSASISSTSAPDAQIAASRAQKLPMPVGNFAPWMTAKAIAKMP